MFWHAYAMPIKLKMTHVCQNMSLKIVVRFIQYLSLLLVL